ncbi:Hypothetical predicted protein [Paramuricea clavata]|uniref:Uncharacterized protein n=1 Tax=Paramuricea clavata TaxID=317549 RepID=A0A7D9J0A2_PARCT|nr:Hypothetical predicted protein [Paramuricea clavata]
MADKNWLNSVNCVVCGKKDRIMKRCGRCQSIFYCSVECQRIDWVTHKANCCMYISSKMHESGDDHDDDNTVTMKLDKTLDANDTIGQTTGRKCNTVNYKNKLQELAQKENAEQDLHKPLVENCQFTSQINLDPSESFLNHGVRDISLVKSAHTVKQQTEIVEEITKLKENEKSVVSHVVSCSHNQMPTTSQDDISNVVVYVKYAKKKHKVELGLPCTGLQVLEHFSRVLHVPIGRLKLIHKGKLQTELTILGRLKPNAVFLAFGEIAESEDGLEPEDIELIMKQLSVERNVAIKALRKTNCLVDAIFEIGNDM